MWFGVATGILTDLKYNLKQAKGIDASCVDLPTDICPCATHPLALKDADMADGDGVWRFQLLLVHAPEKINCLFPVVVTGVWKRAISKRKGSAGKDIKFMSGWSVALLHVANIHVWKCTIGRAQDNTLTFCVDYFSDDSILTPDYIVCEIPTLRARPEHEPAADCGKMMLFTSPEISKAFGVCQ